MAIAEILHSLRRDVTGKGLPPGATTAVTQVHSSRRLSRMLFAMRASFVLQPEPVAVVAAACRRANRHGPYNNTYTINEARARRVYTLTWALTPGAPAIGNSTFIVGERDVIVIDTGLSRSGGEAILAGLRQVTDKPVSMVINTHWHGDHIFGNQVFRNAFPAARFVGIPRRARASSPAKSIIAMLTVRRPSARIAELRARAARTDRGYTRARAARRCRSTRGRATTCCRICWSINT